MKQPSRVMGAAVRIWRSTAAVSWAVLAAFHVLNHDAKCNDEVPMLQQERTSVCQSILPRLDAAELPLVTCICLAAQPCAPTSMLAHVFDAAP